MPSHRSWKEAKTRLFDHYVRGVEGTYGDKGAKCSGSKDLTPA